MSTIRKYYKHTEQRKLWAETMARLLQNFNAISKIVLIVILLGVAGVVSGIYILSRLGGPFPPFVEAVDTDGDGLLDVKEMEIGTDLNNPNTDGDRYGDGEEYNGTIPGYVKEPGRSPLFPAYPDLKIELSASYHIWLKQDITTATEIIESSDYEYAIETLETTTTDFSNQLTVKVGYSLSNLGISVVDQFNFARSHTIVTRTTQRFLMASGKTWSEALSTDLGDSYLYVTMRIKNVGSDILESEPADIWLSLYVGDDYDPIKTWSFASSYQGARISPLTPGETRTINVEFHESLSIDLLKRIESGEPVRIEIQGYDLGEDRVYLQNVKDTLIQLDIDDGSTLTTAYYIENSIKLTDFLTKYANMVMSENVVYSIADLPNSENAWWEIILPKKVEIPSNILDATISRGDHVVLLYQRHSDGDGILDRDEFMMGLNPNLDDTDNDGLNDYEEVYGVYGTNPLNSDTDFDGLNDGEETKLGFDGYITSPTNADSDADGLDDYEEFLNGTSPNNSDTDADELTDGEEVNPYQTDPKNADTDNDGLNDGQEVSIGSNPLNPDTDDDGYVDGDDINPLRDIVMHVNLTKMEAEGGDEFWTALDVYFRIYIYDSNEDLLSEERYDCPDNTNSHEMNYSFSHNIPDNETYIYIKIEAWDRDILFDDRLDLTGGWDDGKDPLHVYFYYDLKTNTWYEIYGGDSESDGVTSGLDDGVGGGDVTLWYWLYTG